MTKLYILDITVIKSKKLLNLHFENDILTYDNKHVHMSFHDKPY